MLDSETIVFNALTSGKCMIHVSIIPPPVLVLQLLPSPHSASDLLFFGLLMYITTIYRLETYLKNIHNHIILVK